MPRSLLRSLYVKPFLVLLLLLTLMSSPGGQSSLANSLRPTASASKAVAADDLVADGATPCASSAFAGALSFKLLDQPRTAAVADFNGDSKPDIVTPADSSNKILVMLGNGAGDFSPATTFATDGFAVSVAVGDFNGDSKVDIVAANAFPGSLSIFIGNGTGGFAAANNMATAGNPSFVMVADFNRDQKADLAVAQSNGTIAIMLGDGAGGFTTTSFAGSSSYLTTGDFNLDGNLDIAGVAGDHVSIFSGDGLGGFGAAQSFTAAPETTSLAPADFNSDGKLDLAVSVYANKIAVLLNNGDGTFGSPTTYAVPGQTPVQSVVVGDFDNDGHIDLAGASVFFVSVWFGDGTGSFARQTNYRVGLGPTFLTTNDFNGDGSSDLIAVGYSAASLVLLTNDGTGNFLTAARYAVGQDPNSVLKADFNNDGKLDLATANRDSNDVSILLGNGAGAFTAAINFSVGPPPPSFAGNQPFSLASGDFNGDNKTDLVTANFTGGGVSILLGDGAGNFPSAQKINLGINAWYVAVGEFNTDGKQDLVVTGNGSNNVAVMLGDGNGNFAAPVNLSGLQGPRPIAVADFNADTKADIVVGNQSGMNEVVVFLGNGSGGFGAGTNFTIELFARPSSIAVGDFNGDTKPDLVVAEEGKDRVALLAGNGSGGFSAPVMFNVGGAPSGLAIADFNGDGFRDVVVANSESLDVSLLFGNGSGGFTSGPTYAAGLSSSVAAGDFNSDGRIDFATEGVDVFNSICVDTPVTPLPALSVSDPSSSEESGSITFLLTLAAASSQQVTVQVYTSGLSAVSGVDFQPTTGSLTFLPGETAKNVVVPILNDSISEFAERFSLNLHHPVNATILKRQGIATVTDSDLEPSITINNVSVNEGNGGSTPAQFTLALSSPSGKLVSLNYATADGTATAGQDYQAASGTLSIGAGAATKTLAIAVTGDTVFEPNETFVVNLSNPVNAGIADAQGMATIIDDDNTIQFSSESYFFNEDVGSGVVTVIRSAGTSNAATVDYATSDNAGSSTCININGRASSRCDYATTIGTLHFAAGETSKTISIPITNDSLIEGGELFMVSLSNPSGATLNSPTLATINIVDNDSVNGPNPIDQAEFFVRQHYIDFLNREADPAGLAFWTNQITECQQPGATCSAEVRRINVSAAFFLSIEFQETGFLVYRFYKSAYGNIVGTPVPLRLLEFLPDTQQLGQGVIIGQPDAEQVLEANKAAYAMDFVSRSRFTTAYPTMLTPAQFVDALFTNAGVTPSTIDRDAAINEFGGSGNTANTAARARALRRVAENSTLRTQEKNKAFVLMQYFGYLRRNPNDPPEANLDFSGYNFWLGKLNEFNGNFVNADMVKAFLVSGEYRHRFGP
jgi:hypothetical protein